MRSPKVTCLGVHILDLLASPVPGPPAPAGLVHLDQFRMTAAGTAAGTAVDLAKLGAQVTAMGAIGDDLEGRIVTELMEDHGVDVSRLVRDPAAGTQISILMIGEDGERHTVLVRRGPTHLGLEALDRDVVAAADVLHVGGADILAEPVLEPLAQLMAVARERGVKTTLDVLSVCDQNIREQLAPVLGQAQYFFPNEHQLAGLTGSDDPETAIEILRGLGVENVVATLGGEGSIARGPQGEARVPALEVEMVDSTGCGDAFVAGFIVAMANVWELESSVWLGAASAALAATGLGSDAGIVDLPGTLEFLASRSPAPVDDIARAAIPA